MSLEFEIATRYRINGEVRGNQVIIYENSFEVLEPNACDNGKRRLDAYEGQASTEELRLVWGVGGQVLHRPHPGVPTQRFEASYFFSSASITDLNFSVGCAPTSRVPLMK